MKKRIKMMEVWYREQKISVETLIPVLHFILTFFFERILFVFSNNWDVFVEVPRKTSVSNLTENVIVYCLSKMWALVIIYLIWKLIFAIVNKKIPRDITVLFLLIYVVGAFVNLLNYPSLVSIDNYATYSYAIRFLPSYWHSIFTGALYAGSMMVLPHPFSIFLFRLLAFDATVAYIYCKLRKVYHGSNLCFLALLFLVLPETLNILANPYRTHDYVTLCLFYFAYIFFETKEESGDKFRKLLIISVLSGFVMVWRSEGIILGLGGLCFSLLNAYKLNKKRILALLLVFAGAFACFSKAQGIGSEKYFGQDYMMMNTLHPLYSILNNPNANFSYAGASEDLEALGAVTPVEFLKQYGDTAGYRNYNYSVRGHVDFNQSGVDDETAARYMRAYFRIILHNLNDYLNVQINFFFGSLGIGSRHAVYSYTDEEKTELAPFVYNFWQKGHEDIMGTFLSESWAQNTTRIYLNAIVENLKTTWRELWTGTGLNVLLHTCAVISIVVFMCVEFILACTQRTRRHIGWFIFWATNFGELCSIALFMPGSFPLYTYPILYPAYLLLCFYLADKPLKNNTLTEQNPGLHEPEPKLRTAAGKGRKALKMQSKK